MQSCTHTNTHTERAPRVGGQAAIGKLQRIYTHTYNAHVSCSVLLREKTSILKKKLSKPVISVDVSCQKSASPKLGNLFITITVVSEHQALSYPIEKKAA